jgi:hypothetical protein
VGLHDRSSLWNVGDSVVLHRQLKYNGFPMDGALVGAAG